MKLHPIVFAASLLMLPVGVRAAAACCAEAPPLADQTPLSAKSIYQLDLKLTDDAGHPFRLVELQGHPIILTMFYSQCSYACPTLVEDMRKIQTSLPADVAEQTTLLLVSFDTEHDDTAALHAYREKHNLGPQWKLVRGSPEDIRSLAMVLGVQYKAEGAGFAHSNLITILNKGGEVSHQRVGFQDKISDSANAVIAATR